MLPIKGTPTIKKSNDNKCNDKKKNTMASNTHAKYQNIGNEKQSHAFNYILEKKNANGLT